MKAILTALLLLSSNWTYAEEAKKEEEWHETTLSDETIKKIQQAQYTYKKCVVDAMSKPEFAQLESRNATDAVIRQCEPVLGDIRKVYTDVEVPGVIADRHLKKLRIQVTRSVLQELMYKEAAKKAGQP
ncbi:hypothetical protein KEF85_04730 [Methylomonas paludis]|uniref:Uncharacterized protein n=1 Tax=Methylomonas paludis TaxID=1173101 RepID=A0A975MPU9_9GAMM|nr:hypothetical protein [Methylomonas paludis]QWF71782.1 hypothetical protein KEF85_04730 [Methylomonas paludis]